MKKIAIYPGTFDPITNGHIDLVKKTLNIFDEIVVAVSTAYGEKTLFDLDLRETMIKEFFASNSRVKVVSFEDLLVDTAVKHDACAIVRGLRAVSDFDYEFQMSSMNSKLNRDIQTIFFTPSEKFSYISSTLVRTVAIHNCKRVGEFVPQNVFEQIKLRYNKG